MRRVRFLVRKELLELRQNPKLLRVLIAAPVFQLLRRAVTAVYAGIRLQLSEMIRVNSQAFGLTVGPMRTSAVRTLIPDESKPAKVVEDGRLAQRGGSFLIRVFDPERERAAVVPRENPVHDGGSRVADVQVPGRARREPRAHRAIHNFP